LPSQGWQNLSRLASSGLREDVTLDKYRYWTKPSQIIDLGVRPTTNN